jgi:NAD-dependent deacetylase
MQQEFGHSPIVILTGAGISKESGIDTFRDADGLWTRVNLEEVATIEAWHRDPAKVLDFHNAGRAFFAGRNITPNAAHRALARLEREWPGEVLVVTQNIDLLHEGAGSRNVLHMHGQAGKLRCMACETVTDSDVELSVKTVCVSCGAVGQTRPHVVWFGEMPLHMDAIMAALDGCGLFISIGTSGAVYPAAGFVQHVRRGRRAPTVELNKERSEGYQMFQYGIYGPATEVVPAFVDTRLKGGTSHA